jgi:hypothetical protein
MQSFKGKTVNIREIKRNEISRFDELLEEFHYIGKSRSVGDSIRMVAEVDGEWAGLLMWGSASYRLKDRDSLIGWTDVQRAQRQKLIVQNRRFSLLVERGEHPNLASKILGAAVRELPEMWFSKFGYKPLLAETFTDIEAYEGTCYKASGWIEVGKSKGFSRHKSDFYVPNDRPKKIWLKKLHNNAGELLRSFDLPDEFIKGAQSDSDGILPINSKQIQSLFSVLRKTPDTRTSNTTYRIGSVLSIVAMAVFSGHKNISEIVRFAERMKMQHRKAIGLPIYKKGSSYRKTPSYKVFYNLLSKLDIEEFAQILSHWLASHNGSLPAALALDGKFIKDTVGIVCMVDHETGVPVAMKKVAKKEGDKGDCEMIAGRKMIKKHKDLSGSIITADALHCQRATAQEIVANGGEYILQVKKNQKNILKSSEIKTKDLSPFLT